MSTPNKILTYKTDPRAGDITARIHHPPSSSSTHYPIALIFHAGGGMTGSALMVPASEIDYLVNTLNFVVVNANYRLAPQVGMYDGSMTDARDLLRWSRKALPSLLESDGVLVDTTKVVALGHSAGAQIALSLGSAPNPPKALMDMYGPKFLSDEYYATPMPQFAKMPDVPKELLNKVYEGPVPTSTGPAFKDGKPILDDPRFAVLFMGLKNGTQIADAIVDGDLDRCDPMTMVNKDWPPTFFLHGAEDKIVPSRFAVKAGEKLDEFGVENEVVIVEGKDHAYDLQAFNEGVAEEIKKGFDFLKTHV